MVGDHANDVQAAIAAGIAVADRPGVTTRHTVIPIQDDALRARIQAATELYPSGDGTRDQPTAGKRASRR